MDVGVVVGAGRRLDCRGSGDVLHGGLHVLVCVGDLRCESLTWTEVVVGIVKCFDVEVG